jgi:hypothetical protein
MDADDTLEQIVLLNDIIENDTRVMKAYAERFARIKANLEVLKVRQQTLIFDLAKWTICEGLTGPTYRLPVYEPSAFIFAMCDLLESQRLIA